MNIQKFEAATMTLKEITDLLEVRHNDAMSVVSKMIENDAFGHATKISYRTSQGNEYETYRLDKRQSIAVAAKLNTSLLMRIIDRWQELETPTPMTMSEFALYSAQRMVEIEMEQKRLAIEQHEIKSQLKAIVDGEDYFTVVGYCNMTKRRLDQKETARMGKLVTAYCNDECLAIGQSKHPNFGHVNSYPLDALKVVFGD